MVTLFYVSVFLALWHFFYEGILAPSLRHGLRYEFFSLRDQLRLLKINGFKKGVDNDVYQILDHTICGIIKSMSFITLANYFLMKKDFAENKEYKEDADYVSNLMSKVKEQKLILIDERLRKLSSKALLINNGGWLPYLLPVFIIALILSLVFSQINRVLRMLNDVSTRLVYGAEKLNKIPEAIRVA